MQIQHLCQIHLIAPIHWVSVWLRMLWMNWPCCLILRDASLAAASHFPQHLQRQIFNFSLLFSLRCSAFRFPFCSLEFAIFSSHFSHCFSLWHFSFESRICASLSLFPSLSISRCACLDFRQYSLRFLGVNLHASNGIGENSRLSFTILANWN